MHKSEYFLHAIRQAYYRDRRWILRAMTVPAGNRPAKKIYPGYQDGVWTILDSSGNEIPLEGGEANKPLFPIKEPLTITPDTFVSAREETVTCYGAAILNAIIFVWPFGDKFPYISERFDKKVLSKRVGAALEGDDISVEEYLKFIQAMNHITVFTSIAVVAATPKSLTASPEALRIKAELLEKYKDRLDEPAIVAMIDEAVAAADREYIKGDPSEKFFLKGKSYDVIRKKLFTLQGGNPKLDDPSKMDYIPRSLDEGYAPEDLPSIINTLRSGSYDRGAETALGGEAAKFSNRVFQNLKIAEEDCGTHVGKPEFIDNSEELVGRYLVGQENPLTLDDIRRLDKQWVFLRDPTACKTPNRAYCEKCLGRTEADSGVGMGPRMAEICNRFMEISLAAFHGFTSRTVEFNPFEDIF